eukprot:1625202-Pleurochrysis_carterae.AAC.7
MGRKSRHAARRGRRAEPARRVICSAVMMAFLVLGCAAPIEPRRYAAAAVSNTTLAALWLHCG